MTDSSSQLVQRTKYRHNMALSVFANSIRELNVECDTSTRNCIAKLQKKLLESRTYSNNMLMIEAAIIEQHRQIIKCSCEAFEADQLHPVLLEDEFHREGADSINFRGNRARIRRTKLLEQAQQSVSSYIKQMTIIESSQNEIRNIEKIRREKLQDSLDTLCISMSAAAFVEETELQVVIQRATHQCNQQLLLNQASLFQSISKLKEREILHQRHILQKWATMYHTLLNVIRDSFLLWTAQYLSCEIFYDPPHRKDALRVACEKNKVISTEVHNLICGLTGLSATLLKRRCGSKLKEICGGTVQKGWLRAFDDDFHKPVLLDSTERITEEWYNFSSVVVNNARVKMAKIIDDMQEGEHVMIHRIATTEQQLISQLVELYTPTEEEIKVINQCCIEDGFTFPLHSIGEDTVMITRCREEVTLLLSDIVLRVKNESDYFMMMLRVRCDCCIQELIGQLIDGERSAMVVVGETSRLLESHLTASHSILRSYWVMQEECTNDYNDSKTRLEDDFADVKFKLSRAGYVEDAGKLYVTGMQMLNAIEELYHTYHRTCVGSMTGFQEDLSNVLNSQRVSLFQKLHIEEVSIEADAATSEATIIREDETAYLITHKDWELDSPVVLQAASVKSDVPEEPSPVTPLGSKKGKIKPSRVQSKRSSDDGISQQKNINERNDTVSLQTTDKLVAVESPNPPTVSSHFIDHCRELLLQSYPLKECLVSFADLAMFKKETQINLAKWSLALGKHCILSAQDYCRERRISINADINFLIRNHTRRPVDLQSNIYEVRIRELQMSSQSLSQQIAMLHQRVVALKVLQEALVADSNALFAEDVEIIYGFTVKIPQCPSRAALETHHRAMKDMSCKITNTIDSRAQTLQNQLQDQVRSIKQDCENFLKNSCKTHDEGGTLSLEEQRDSYSRLDAILLDLSVTEEHCTKSVLGAEFESEMSKLREAEMEFEESKSRSEKEINFFDCLNRNVSDLKAKVSNVLLLAENEGNQLEKLVVDLEDVVAEKDSDRSLITFSSIMENLQTEGRVPDTWDESDELLSSKLRRLQTEIDFKLQQSRSQRILEALRNIRVPLFKNSISIGCLKHCVTLATLPPDTYVDPGEEWSRALIGFDGAIALISTRTEGRGSKADPKALTPNLGKAVNPPHVMFEVTTDGVGVPVTEPLPLVEPLSSITVEWAAATTAKVRDIVEQFCTEDNGINCPVIRGHVMGSDQSEIQKNVEWKVEQQCDRVNSYCEAAHKKLMNCISRVQVALAEASEGIFKSLLRCCVNSLGLRLKETLNVFTNYYNKMSEAQRSNNDRLKGSLFVPSNRDALVALRDCEAARQTAAQEITKKMWAICMREIQSEARRSALRFTSTIQIFFAIVKGIVSPAHVIHGAPPVGHHMGLRRLVLRKEKELPLTDLHGYSYVSGIDGEQRPDSRGGRAGQGNTKGSTTERSKKDEKRKENKKKLHESPTPDVSRSPVGHLHMLSPLVVPEAEYGGVELDVITVFDAFAAQSVDVAKSLVNHYLLPSQWEQDAANKSARSLAEHTSTDSQKNTSKKEKDKTMKGITAIYAVGDSAVAAPSGSHTRERSIKLSGPGDVLHRRAFACRQTSLDSLNTNFNSVAGDATQYFCRILLSERQWSISWKEALSKIA